MNLFIHFFSLFKKRIYSCSNLFPGVFPSNWLYKVLTSRCPMSTFATVNFKIIIIFERWQNVAWFAIDLGGSRFSAFISRLTQVDCQVFRNSGKPESSTNQHYCNHLFPTPPITRTRKPTVHYSIVRISKLDIFLNCIFFLRITNSKVFIKPIFGDLQEKNHFNLVQSSRIMKNAPSSSVASL